MSADLEPGGMLHTAGAGRFEDGKLAAIFLNTAKHGSASGPLAHALDLLAEQT
jgi:hypothetical protein